MTEENDSADIRALTELLPFYANGTLDSAGRGRVELGLQRSAWLRREFEAEQLLASTIRAEGERMTDKSEEQTERLETLMERIDSEAPAQEPFLIEQTPASPADVRTIMSYLNPRRWHPALALTLVAAVIAQAVFIGGQSGRIADLEKENFELASGPGGQHSKGDIQLEMNDEASWKDISALLDEEELSITNSGDFGVLTVRSNHENAALTAQIERLRKSPLVASAEPAA